MFPSWEKTLCALALCSIHPVSHLNFFEEVKGNNIPPEKSMRSFLKTPSLFPKLCVQVK